MAWGRSNNVGEVDLLEDFRQQWKGVMDINITALYTGEKVFNRRFQDEREIFRQILLESYWNTHNLAGYA